MGIEDLFKKVSEVPAVKLFMDTFGVLGKGKPSMAERQNLQKQARDLAKSDPKLTKDLNDAEKIDNKANAENRVRALMNEGLGHQTRLAVLERVKERTAELKAKGLSNSGAVITHLEDRQTKQRKDGNLDTYFNEHRASTFEATTRRLLSGTDGRRLDELKISHDGQVNSLKTKIIADTSRPDDTVIDYLADELVLAALKKRPSTTEDPNAALNAIEADLSSEAERVRRRTLTVSARIISLQS